MSSLRKRLRAREKPGAKGEGVYFRIVIRPKEDFVTFHDHVIGEPGHILRLAGKRQSGSFDTQGWLISKKDTHVENGRTLPDTEDARRVLEKLGSEPEYAEGTIFKAKPMPDFPEAETRMLVPKIPGKRVWKKNGCVFSGKRGVVVLLLRSLGPMKRPQTHSKTNLGTRTRAKLKQPRENNGAHRGNLNLKIIGYKRIPCPP